MDYLSHSARNGIPEQSYQEHAQNVGRDALRFASDTASYAAYDGGLLLTAVRNAAQIHDLGKLLPENQTVLHIADNRKKLPVNHVDAGVALLHNAENESLYSQMIVYSHHRGLPDIDNEVRRGSAAFRDTEHRKETDAELPWLQKLHESIMKGNVIRPEGGNQGDISVLSRLMLSCLVDADHSDTARHYGRYPDSEKMPELLPAQRLKALDSYINKKKRDGDGERNRLRTEMYEACKNSGVSERIVYCDSPVGSGKTTAVMAYLLQEAVRRKSRHIFVVLPYTNIIRQSVEVYRKALVLDGEDPESVVAELHHLADFEEESVRDLSAQWKAPIIVTTAVAFFETLASNRPAALRRLHELPGSVIFVDEAHAAVPVRLLPLTWHWMEAYADEWSCKWILASGSLVKFWTLSEISQEQREVPAILSEELRNKLQTFEKRRIKICSEKNPLSCEQLLEKILSAPGPRLVIMNTVKGAAVIASLLAERCGNAKVMHLSTALTAEDRETTVKLVSERLENNADCDWTLVATSCVEAGVNFSFQTGFRERASILSLLQASGRVNRDGDKADAVIWDFSMQQDKRLSENEALQTAISVLCEIIRMGKSFTDPELSTWAIGRELDRISSVNEKGSLLGSEQNMDFPAVQEKYRVIEADTVLVTADDELKEKIRNRSAAWRDIQRKCVSLYVRKASILQLKPLCEGVFEWDSGYDSFIGIMKGVLRTQEIKEGVLLL